MFLTLSLATSIFCLPAVFQHDGARGVPSELTRGFVSHNAGRDTCAVGHRGGAGVARNMISVCDDENAAARGRIQ